MIDDIYTGSLPTITVGEEYLLREQKDADADSYFEYMKDGVIGKYILASDPRSKAEALAEIRYCRNMFRTKRGMYWTLAKKEDDEMIGAVGMYTNNFHHRAELCYDLSQAYHRQGIMTEALIAALNFAMNHAGFERIEAVTMPENDASGGILLKMGFDFEGLLKKYRYYEGNFYDVNMYAITKEMFLERAPKAKQSPLDKLLDGMSHETDTDKTA